MTLSSKDLDNHQNYDISALVRLRGGYKRPAVLPKALIMRSARRKVVVRIKMVPKSP